jgi:hypothetical protein
MEYLRFAVIDPDQGMKMGGHWRFLLVGCTGIIARRGARANTRCCVRD